MQDDIEYVTVEILRNKGKNVIFSLFTNLREVTHKYFWIIQKFLLKNLKGKRNKYFWLVILI